MVEHPEITLHLVWEDGNAFAIVPPARSARWRGGVPKEEIEAFTTQITSGDFGHLLGTVQEWMEVVTR